MNRESPEDRRWIRWGIVADAAFKLALTLTYLTLAIPASDTLDVPTWLIYLTAALLLVSGLAGFRGRRLPPAILAICTIAAMRRHQHRKSLL